MSKIVPKLLLSKKSIRECLTESMTKSKIERALEDEGYNIQNFTITQKGSKFIIRSGYLDEVTCEDIVDALAGEDTMILDNGDVVVK